MLSTETSDFSFAFKSKTFSDRILILEDTPPQKHPSEYSQDYDHDDDKLNASKSPSQSIIKGLDDDEEEEEGEEGNREMRRKEFPVNSIILAKGSHFFMALLTSDFKEKLTKEIIVKQPYDVEFFSRVA